MGSQLFNMMNSGVQMPGALGDFQNFVNQFNQFRSMFQGNAQQRVQQLLQNGQMTQDQFNQLSQLATQIQNRMNPNR